MAPAREEPSAIRMPISRVRLGYAVGEHAVDADGCQEQSEQAEARGQAQGQALTIECLCNSYLHSLNLQLSQGRARPA